MVVVVIGKEHIAGVSKKSGKAFDNNVVHYTGNKYGVDGLAGFTAWLDPAINPLDTIQVGKKYNIDFDNKGYVVGFSLAQ